MPRTRRLVCGSCNVAVAQTSPSTITTLTITSGGNAVTTVAQGSVVTLTATVNAGSTAITPGQVNFCVATAKSCTDIHLLGTAQLTSAGTAVLKFRPGIGSHSYQAKFLGTNSYAASASASAPLAVTGLHPTSTGGGVVGGLGTYTVTPVATGTGAWSPPPTGSVSLIDTSNGNAILAQVPLVNPAAPTFGVLYPLGNGQGPTIGDNPLAIAVGDFNGDGIPDLAIADGRTDSTVWLGNGDGTFKSAGNISTVPCTVIAVADFNSDGIPDLALVMWGEFNHPVGNRRWNVYNRDESCGDRCSKHRSRRFQWGRYPRPCCSRAPTENQSQCCLVTEMEHLPRRPS